MILSATERKATSQLLFDLIQGGDKKFAEILKVIEESCLDKQHISAWKKAIHHVLKEGVEGLQCLFDTIHCAVLQESHEPLPCLWTSIVGIYLRQMNLLFKRLSIVEIVTLHTFFVQYCRPLSLLGLNEAEETGMESSILEEKPSMANYQSFAMDVSMTSLPSSPCLSPNSLAAAKEQDTKLRMEGIEETTSKTRDEQAESHVNQESSLLKAVLKESACNWSIQQAEQLIGDQTQLLEFNEKAAMSPKDLNDTLQQILAIYPQLSSAHYLSCLNFLRLNEAKGAVESLASAYDCQQVTRSTPRTLRYAALNMAALYSHFGSRAVALRCVSEVIAQSQEASDHTCLQHALAWLYVLSPHDKRESLMQSAIQRSTYLQLPYLQWLGLVNQTALPTTKSPSQRLQMLVSRVDGCGGVTGGGVGCVGGVWGVEAGVWVGWLGNSSSMSVVCSQLVLHSPPTLQHQPTLPYTTSQTAATLCNIASALADAGEYRLCTILLMETKKIFPGNSPHNKYIRLTEAHVSCTRRMFYGSYSKAIAALAPIAPQHKIYHKMRSCEVAVYQGESECALQLVSELLSIPEVADTPMLTVQAKMLYASALCGSRNFSTALDTLLTALALAKKHHFAMLHSLATLHLLAVQLNAGLLRYNPANSETYERLENPSVHASHFYDVPNIVDKVALDRALAVIMTSGSLYDQARSLFLLAKLRVKAANKKVERISRVASDMERIADMFRKAEAYHRVRDVIYVTSRLWHDAGEIDNRNKAALAFRKLEETPPCKNILPPTPIF